MTEQREQELDNIQNGSLVGLQPANVLLLYGPTKRLLTNYHWHLPNKGIVTSYSPTERDVEDHFGLFRGVDQIEAFAQASVVSCGGFLECRKLNCTFDELKDILIPAFISVGNVFFHNYVQLGDTFISIGYITFYKWRQMVCNGRIYKVPKDFDLDEYFKDFTEERLLKYDISEDFTLVAELFDITGRGIKVDLLKKQV
jgi:hypothetical protein